MDGNNEFFENFERNKYLKKLPSMQRVKRVKTLPYSVAAIPSCVKLSYEKRLWSLYSLLKTSCQV